MSYDELLAWATEPGDIDRDEFFTTLGWALLELAWQEQSHDILLL